MHHLSGNLHCIVCNETVNVTNFNISMISVYMKMQHNKSKQKFKGWVGGAKVCFSPITTVCGQNNT